MCVRVIILTDLIISIRVHLIQRCPPMAAKSLLAMTSDTALKDGDDQFECMARPLQPTKESYATIYHIDEHNVTRVKHLGHLTLENNICFISKTVLFACCNGAIMNDYCGNCDSAKHASHPCQSRRARVLYRS